MRSSKSNCSASSRINSTALNEARPARIAVVIVPVTAAAVRIVGELSEKNLPNRLAMLLISIQQLLVGLVECVASTEIGCQFVLPHYLFTSQSLLPRFGLLPRLADTAGAGTSQVLAGFPLFEFRDTFVETILLLGQAVY